MDKPETILIVARHCRTCKTVLIGRRDWVPGLNPDAHEVPGFRLPCERPDFGPSVTVCEVPE